MKILLFVFVLLSSATSLRTLQDESIADTASADTDLSQSDGQTQGSSQSDSQDTNSIDTSTGKIAAGIEEVGQKISDFSNEVSESLQSLNEKIDIHQDINAAASYTLLNNEIDKLNEEIQDIEVQIDNIELTIIELEKNCKNLHSC